MSSPNGNHVASPPLRRDLINQQCTRGILRGVLESTLYLNREYPDISYIEYRLQWYFTCSNSVNLDMCEDRHVFTLYSNNTYKKVCGAFINSAVTSTSFSYIHFSVTSKICCNVTMAPKHLIVWSWRVAVSISN